MTILIGQFDRVAETLTDRLAEILGVPVAVVDDHDSLVASSPVERCGLGADDWRAECTSQDLRLPIRLHGRDGAVVVRTAAGEHMAPRLVQALVDMTINQALVVAGLPNEHELKNKFIHDLLLGPVGDEADTLREGQILGMDLTRPRAVILINAADYILAPGGPGWMEASESRIRRRTQLVIDCVVHFFHLPDDTICAYIGDGEVAVLKASSTQDLAAWTDRDAPPPVEANGSWADLAALKRACSGLLTRLRTDTHGAISIGVGRYHPGLRGLARSYQDARAALSLGRRFHGRNQVHCLDSLGIAAFVGVPDERTKIELARHLLSPLDHESELLDTLDIFFLEDCSASTTASRLSIHRNTLSYRLDKIASLTGLDPRRFDDAVQIRLSLLLRALKGAPSD